MALTEKRSLTSGSNFKQYLGVFVLLAIVVVAVATDSLIIGYVGMTLVLCAFFLVVAFDIGLKKDEPGRVADATRTEAPTEGSGR